MAKLKGAPIGGLPRNIFQYPIPSNPAPAGSGGGDLLSTNNLSDVANAATARANLGIVALLAFSATFGDGAASSFVIPHGLGVNRLVPFIIKVSTGDQAVCDINITTTNITLNFDGLPVPTLNEFRVTVIGF